MGICSVKRAGRTDEDASLLELDYPVTTDLDKTQKCLESKHSGALTVVSRTYQSMTLVEAAQTAEAPASDLVACDEAHRTTGLEDTERNRKDRLQTSPFRLVHDALRLQATRWLYTTATPGIYTSTVRSRAATYRDLEVYSMDDERIHCLTFHGMRFPEAIEGAGRPASR